MMNNDNKNYQTAQRLLMKNPDQSEDFKGEISDFKPHTKDNIIPPIGIADPKLVESFMKHPEDEDKILRDVADLEAYHKENILDTSVREGKSYGLRALEGLGGSIGAMMNALSGEAYFDDNGELLKTEVPMLPSAGKLREFTKEQTGEKYEPKTEFAKESHEAVTDIGAMAPFPGGMLSKLLLPVMGQGVKVLAKNQGATESQADMIKLTFMMGSTIGNIGNAPRFARQAYNEAINMIPQGTRMSTRAIQNGLGNIRNRPWFRTGRTTSKGPAMDEIQRIENAMQHGSMDVHDAMQIRRDINEARKKLGAFNYEPGIDKAAARRYLDEVDEVLSDGLSQYGRQNNPQWLHQYERANQAYAVTQRSRQLQDYIQSNALTKPLQSQTAKTLFHLGGASAITQVPAILGAAAPVAAGAKGIQIMNRMFRSPVLRNHYFDVLRQASLQNAGAMNRALQKFDIESKKLEKQIVKTNQK